MKRDGDPNQLLLELVRSQGPGVIHLPYTQKFHELCSSIKQSPSIEDMHEIWERVVRLQAQPSSPAPSSPPSSEGASRAVELNRTLPLSRPPATPFTAPPQPLLFDDDQPVQAQQPWTAPPEPVISPEQEEKRNKLLADLANSYLGNREQRVANILQRFPETRDSDTALCIRYWKMYQAEILERWRPLELEVLYELDRIETIGRVRRMIQNDLRLFRGLEETKRCRELLQKEFHEYLASHQETLPEVRFYLDETGNEGDKTYTGVAGVCVMNWKQYEKHHAAIAKWRKDQGWPETIHFAETGADKVDRAVALMAQLERRRSGILFLGYALASRGRTNEDLFSLFIQLVIDSLKHLRECGCLNEPRSVQVIKEANAGFDSLFLEKMTKQLGESVALEFPGQLVVKPIEAVTKGRYVLLECADLVAGGMQRRALGKGRNPKDKLAEAVINVTGFEDATDAGAVFKFYPSA